MWKVVLENESGDSICFLNEEVMLVGIEDCILLKYLDPYGDTVFNALQMKDVILDLEAIRSINLPHIIDGIIGLAVKGIDTVHSYLVFYGD